MTGSWFQVGTCLIKTSRSRDRSGRRWKSSRSWRRKGTPQGCMQERTQSCKDHSFDCSNPTGCNNSDKESARGLEAGRTWEQGDKPTQGRRTVPGQTPSTKSKVLAQTVSLTPPLGASPGPAAIPKLSNPPRAAKLFLSAPASGLVMVCRAGCPFLQAREKLPLAGYAQNPRRPCSLWAISDAGTQAFPENWKWTEHREPVFRRDGSQTQGTKEAQGHRQNLGEREAGMIETAWTTPYLVAA